MYKNVTISDLNVAIHGKGNSIRKYFVPKLGIFIIEFLVASIFNCYGIFLSEYVILGIHSYERAVGTSILFICSYNFTEPLSRFIWEYFEDRKNIFFRYLITISTMLLFLGLMVPNNITAYTILGGMFSNMICTQLYYFAIDRLDMDVKVIEALRQVARALSLFIMPQLVYYLMTNYAINHAKFLLASIILHIIPSALLIKIKSKGFYDPNNEVMNRYETIGRYSHRISSEMTEFKNFVDNESEERTNEEDVEDIVEKIGPKLNTNYSKISVSHGGIDNEALRIPNLASSSHIPGFLHDIPEESESESEKEMDNIVRDLNVKICENEKPQVYNINELIGSPKLEPINKIEYIQNFREENSRVSVLNELKYIRKAGKCCHCSPYQKYVCSKRLRTLKDFLMDNFLRPIYHSFKTLYFYSALTTKVTTNAVSTLYITLAPFMAMQNCWKQHYLLFNTENVTFLLTYVAFAWCFFLVGLPLVFKWNHNRIRILFVFGLLICGTSMLIFSRQVTNDVITLSSLLFGFGHGIVSYTEKIVYKRSIGMRPWYIVQGPLDVISGICILVIYYFSYLYKIHLNILLIVATLSYFGNALLWLWFPFLKYFFNLIKRIVLDERGQQEEFFY
ncbi:hypothetical protein ABEB36_013814 [Hypothenemus hampei]|uniref:Uncharacterized protein n=1 Tax=Hypothenemus hampei TaxID=57062 RepID=A0ABD1E7I0_HYPHA